MAVNHAFRLASRPVGLPTRESFKLFTGDHLGKLVLGVA